MEKVVGITDIVSNVLLSRKEPQDPNDELTYDELTVVVAKTDKRHLDMPPFYTLQGSITMPDPDQLLGSQDADCISGKVDYFYFRSFQSTIYRLEYFLIKV